MAKHRQIQIDMLMHSELQQELAWWGSSQIKTEKYPEGYEYRPRKVILGADAKNQVFVMPQSDTVVEVYPLHKDVAKPIIYRFAEDSHVCYEELGLSRCQLVILYQQQNQKELEEIYWHQVDQY